MALSKSLLEIGCFLNSQRAKRFCVVAVYRDTAVFKPIGLMLMLATANRIMIQNQGHVQMGMRVHGL